MDFVGSLPIMNRSKSVGSYDYSILNFCLTSQRVGRVRVIQSKYVYTIIIDSGRL